MLSIQTFIDLAMSFPGTEQKPHFDRIAFKVAGRRIFATLHEPTATCNIKLKVVDQETFCAFEGGGIYPVANKWGQQGWTTFELKKVPQELIAEALYTAYSVVVPNKNSGASND